MSMIPVVEIFGPSIQGEGLNAGARCMFIRVKGCDFSCSFCDSKFSWAKEKSHVENYGPAELGEVIITKCTMHNCHRVVLTGGNPCLYDFTLVVAKCQLHDISVDIETQGSIIPAWLTHLDTVVFSPKPPSSGMEDTYLEITDYIENKTYLSSQDVAIKIPVFNQEDIEFARRYAKWVNTFNRCNSKNVKLYLSVGNSDVNTTAQIRDRVLSDYEHLLCIINECPEDFEKVYILPQLHTLVWGNRQGV